MWFATETSGGQPFTEHSGKTIKELIRNIANDTCSLVSPEIEQILFYDDEIEYDFFLTKKQIDRIVLIVSKILDKKSEEKYYEELENRNNEKYA